MPFNIHAIAQKFAPIAGAIALVVSIVLGFMTHFGYLDNTSSSASTRDNNLVIRVTDQHGLPRLCAVDYLGPGPHLDIATPPIRGIYADSFTPGITVTLRFDCGKTPGTQVMDVEVSIPETGVARKDITIPNPDSLLSSSE
ncbi:hypothetical protein [Corynebacterium sp. HS2168-gen11]|uniref:hypothetical protein n=1 Tax=Corynebacterium sp. HS2168-gen11 TaxID=2974027 RepID=UPI00216B3A63|nr:hypothetical protein [Corynebacterium sp. HS2168-gen11]MCS4535918.1 signal peptide protein [Corynebacterium sp. HS2168-gen11]